VNKTDTNSDESIVTTLDVDSIPTTLDSAMVRVLHDVFGGIPLTSMIQALTVSCV
jgi:hypothetical protein